MRRACILLAAILVGPAGADVVHLNDGSSLEGSLRRDGNGWILTDSAGKVTVISDDRVALIEKTAGKNPAESADLKLASLRRAVNNLTDLNLIIDRFTKFIDQNKGLPAATAAQKDLDSWKEKNTKGLIKVGPNWITPAQRDELLKQSVEMVEKARAQLKAGRMRDAAAAIDQLLALNPSNVSAIYLRALVDAKQDQTAAARKNFDRLREAMPDHAPTLNNLAVLMWPREKMGAMALYDLAMAAAPVTRQILDNTAEALNAIPEKDRDHTTYKRALKRFNEQDAELQKKMADEGLYRWGATFVTKEQREELKKAQEKIKEKVDEVVKEGEKIHDRIADNERNIDINNRQMERMRRDSYRFDASGRVVQLALPGSYYEMRRDNEKLLDEQKVNLDKLDAIKVKVKKIQQDLPIPPFTGVQRLIETEGTPLGPPPAKANPPKP